MPLKTTSTNDVPAFLAMAVMNEAAQLEAAGADVIHLEVGQPSTPPPVAVNEALSRRWHRRRPMVIRSPLVKCRLRRRIAEHYQDFYGVAADPGRIAVTPGHPLGFALAFLAALDRGDRIALATPGYPAYRNPMLALGLQPVAMPARAAQNWIPTCRA